MMEFILKKDSLFHFPLLEEFLVAISSILFFSFQDLVEGEFSYWFYSNGLIFLRVGYVILLNGVMAFVVRKLDTIPKIIRETGKKTLIALCFTCYYFVWMCLVSWYIQILRKKLYSIRNNNCSSFNVRLNAWQ